MLGTATTWAVVPPDTRDYWIARAKNTPEAYDNFIQDYPHSPKREAATFRKAVLTNTPQDFRQYLKEFNQGEYKVEVVEKLKTLELEKLQVISQNPTSENVLQFTSDFPESARFPDVKRAIETRHPELAAHLLPVLENACFTSFKIEPSSEKIRQFVTDFPKSEHLNEVVQIAKEIPAVFNNVQPELKTTVQKQLELTPAKSNQKIQANILHFLIILSC